MAWAALVARSTATGAPPLAALQAAWVLVLAANADSPAANDVVLGSVVANRGDAALAVCMAPTISVAPTRVAVAAPDDIAARVLQRLHAANLAAAAHSELPPGGGAARVAAERPYDTLLVVQAGTESSDLWTAVEHAPMETNFSWRRHDRSPPASCISRPHIGPSCSPPRVPR